MCRQVELCITNKLSNHGGALKFNEGLSPDGITEHKSSGSNCKKIYNDYIQVFSLSYSYYIDIFTLRLRYGKTAVSKLFTRTQPRLGFQVNTLTLFSVRTKCEHLFPIFYHLRTYCNQDMIPHTEGREPLMQNENKTTPKSRCNSSL